MSQVRKIMRAIVPLWIRLYYRRLRSFITHEFDHGWHEMADRREFFRKAFTALSFNGISGDYLEFGCHCCRTFNLAYRESRKVLYSCHLWAFDSFQGLPSSQIPEDQHPAWFEGNMKTSLGDFQALCRKHRIPELAYTTVPGYYEQTLNPVDSTGGNLPTDICLVYIDCDMYSSTQTVLRFLGRRLKHGMIIALDDYFCWSRGASSGEKQAWSEFVETHPEYEFIPYVQFGWHGLSYVVEARRTAEAGRGVVD